MREELVKEIRILLSSRKITQAKVSELCGMSRISLNRFLNGRTDLRLDHFFKLCSTLGIKITVPEVKCSRDERGRIPEKTV